MHADLTPVFPEPQRLNRGEGWIVLDAPEHPWRLLLAPGAHPMERLAAERLRAALPAALSAIADEDQTQGARVIALGAAGRRRLPDDLAALPPTPEAYHLAVAGECVCLAGQGPAGTLYAAETFLQLVRREDDRLLFPRVTIADWPDLPHRGLYVESKWGPDLMTLDDWRALVDRMVAWKFNTLDVGIYGCWQLQYPGQRSEWVMAPFPGHPRLRTTKEIAYYSPAAGRQVQLTYLPRMFGEDFFGEVVAYGKARNVLVRPHFNGPGHSTVIPREYPDVSARDEDGSPTGYGYCLSGEATYRLLFALYDSVIERYLEPHGVTGWHMGLDEAVPLRGIDPRDELRAVEPWCRCPTCRARPREELLLDFTFRCLRHLRDRGLDTISVWHDTLDRLGVIEEFGRRLEAEGLRDAVIVNWWRYRDPVPAPRADASRAWVVPMAGYYHWMVYGSYLSNIASHLQAAYEHGAEGAVAYCTYDPAYHRNYLALAEWAWNRSTAGRIYEFEAKYARWLFPEDSARGTVALSKLHEVFGSAPTKALLDSLLYYWYSYPGSRLDFPRAIFRQLLPDRTRLLDALRSCASTLTEAARLLDDLRERAADRQVVDQFRLECRRALAVVGLYTEGLRALREYQRAARDPAAVPAALAQAQEAAQAALDGVERLLAAYEREKPPYLQPQGLRELTYFREFAVDLRDELTAAAQAAARDEPLRGQLPLLDG